MGEKVIFKALMDSSKEFLNYLNQKGISLGTEIEILHREDFDKSLTVAYLDRKEVLSPIVTHKLLVEL